MGRLDSISIKGFKSIRELDFEFRPLNVLIGANGAGKSNFLEFFRFVSEIMNRRLQRYTRFHGGADRILYHGNENAERISFALNFKAQDNSLVNGYKADLTPDSTDEFFFDSEV